MVGGKIKGTRNCGYAPMKDSGCEVELAKNCGYARIEDSGCAVEFNVILALIQFE